jgi:tyrosine-protein phosphatase YwqE
VFNWFKKKYTDQPLLVDLHSHLLPSLDDGVKTFEEAEEIILYFQKLGYRKLITTPHIMSDTYRNTAGGIRQKLVKLQEYLKDKKISIEIEAAAEYYLDEHLYRLLQSDQPLMTFGNKYLLFETNFITEPFILKEFIFSATTKGYKLIFAHPERYLYLHNNLSKAQDLIDRGVLFQINISSITGYYSKPVQQMANKLIERGWVHLLGSDCHHLQHVKLIEEALSFKNFRKALTLPLLNNSLQ